MCGRQNPSFIDDHSSTEMRVVTTSSQGYLDFKHDALLNKSNNQFWKIWKFRFDSERAENYIVSGMGDPVRISETFTEYFCNLYKPSSDEINSKLRDKFEHRFVNYVGDKMKQADFFTVELIVQQQVVFPCAVKWYKYAWGVNLFRRSPVSRKNDGVTSQTLAVLRYSRWRSIWSTNHTCSFSQEL